MALTFDPRNVVKIAKKPTRDQWTQIILFINNRVLYETLFICHREFLTKSKGEIDSYGERWKPLSERTRLYKRLQPGEYKAFGMHRWKGNRKSGGMTKKELLADRNPPINIDTGRLIKAVKPYRFSGGRYIDSPDQSSSINTRNIHFHILVPYADDVNDVRPFFPEFDAPWIEEALERSVPSIQKYLQTLRLI